MTAVADAGPLIHLSWIGQLELLPILFGRVIVPRGVENEVLRAEPGAVGVEAIRRALQTEWLVVQSVMNEGAVSLLTETLDRGESEAIVLLQETQADVLLTDERQARRYAEREGLPLSGTIGILRMARDRGRISAVVPLVADLRSHGFRLSRDLMERLQQEEGV